MGKLLVLIALIALVYWLLRGYRRQLDRGPANAEAKAQEENMVRCAHCGVHLPSSESITTDGRFFCSDEHRRLFRS